MQHAHANGIVHRDLKPQNILIESPDAGDAKSLELHPKIVDFGLAKRIDSSTTVTATGMIVGTPSYMSPEQAIGDNHAVGPSTDVYSLGTVLYETLVGRPPFKGASPIETLAQVRAAEPVKPNLLRPGLPKDLETICLKCLEKLPSDRYPSATALLEDLLRFKDGHPISARPAGLATRTWKWAKRHPASAALIGVSVLAATGLAALGLVYNTYLRSALQEARSEQVRADGNYQLAFKAVDQMLDRVGFAQLADTPEMESVREKLLADAVGFYSKLLDSQPRTDVDSQRQYYAAMSRLGRIQWALGQVESALENLGRAIELQEKLSIENAGHEAIEYELAVSHINRGMVRQDAIDFRTAIALLKSIADTFPSSKKELAQATNNLAVVTTSTADRESLHLSALKLRQELLEGFPNDPGLLYGIGETQNNLGLLYVTTGRIQAAETAYRAALTVFGKLVQEQDGVTDYRIAFAECITHMASLLHSVGRTEEAIAHIEQGTASRKLLAARFPKIPAMREAVIRGLITHATFLIQTSKFAEASELAQQAVDAAVSLTEEFPSTEHQFGVATSLTVLATALSGESKLSDAKLAFQKANMTYNELLKADPNNVVYQTEAGVQFMNFSNVLRSEDAILAAEFNDRSVALLAQVVDRFPDRTDFKSYLFNAHGARAMTYDSLGNHLVAAESWGRAQEMTPPERRFEISLLQSLSLARAGQHALAAQGIHEFLKDDDISGANLYNLACVYGLADLAENGPALTLRSSESSYIHKALEILNRKAAIDFLKVSENRQQLMIDKDLETLRIAPAFKDLLERLDSPGS